MSQPQSSRSWQNRRAELLHEACNEIEKRARDGQPIMRTIRLVARKFRFRSLGAGRRLRLSIKRLECLWYLWSRRRDPLIFALRYRPPFGRIPISDDAVRSLAETRLYGNRSVAAIVRSGEIRADDGRPISVPLVYRRLRENSVPAGKLAEIASTRVKRGAQLARAERRIFRERAKLQRQIHSILA